MDTFANLMTSCVHHSARSLEDETGAVLASSSAIGDWKASVVVVALSGMSVPT